METKRSNWSKNGVKIILILVTLAHAKNKHDFG